MGSTQERIKQRRRYLKRKGAAYTKISLATFLVILLTPIIIVLPTLLVVDLVLPGLLPITPAYRAAGIIAVIGCIATIWYLLVTASRADRTLQQLPYVPPVTADTLPAEEILVRGSEEPTQEQSKVLLRGTKGSAGTGEQELLRSSQGQEE
jgi:hypothetical protein